MKVRAKVVTSTEIPARVEPYTRQTFTTAAKEYDVHAVVALEGCVPFIQFVDDLGYPAWKPLLLFEVTDATVSGDWICNPISTDDRGSLFLLGPAFVADCEESYNAMVELNVEQVERFWSRVNSISRG